MNFPLDLMLKVVYICIRCTNEYANHQLQEELTWNIENLLTVDSGKAVH